LLIVLASTSLDILPVVLTSPGEKVFNKLELKFPTLKILIISLD